MSSNSILDREFLDIRSRILDVAASLDRVGRHDSDLDHDPRMQQLKQALEIVLSDSNRAEQVQRLFSRDYDENWRETFSMPNRAE